MTLNGRKPLLKEGPVVNEEIDNADQHPGWRRNHRIIE